jgi:hypothetical protein
MRIEIDKFDYMTRVEQAIRESLPVQTRVIGVMMKDSSFPGATWEVRFIAAVERRFKVKDKRPLNPDYATVMVCINSEGESMVTAGHYDLLNSNTAMHDMLERVGMDLDTPGNNETMVQLVINEDSFASEMGEPFTDDLLVKFGKDANEAARTMGGYEGWRARRGGRYVFDPDETRTGV